jgi:hypothetical protein
MSVFLKRCSKTWGKFFSVMTNKPFSTCFKVDIFSSLFSFLFLTTVSSFFFAIAGAVSQPSFQAYGNCEVFNELTVVKNRTENKEENISTLKHVENGLLVITEKNFPHVFEQRFRKTDISFPQLLLLGVYSGPSIPSRTNIIKKLENTATLVRRHSNTKLPNFVFEGV